MDSTDLLCAEFSSEFERFHTSLSAVLHKSVLQEQVFIPEFSLHPTAPSFENPQVKAVVFTALKLHHELHTFELFQSRIFPYVSVLTCFDNRLHPEDILLCILYLYLQF